MLITFSANIFATQRRNKVPVRAPTDAPRPGARFTAHRRLAVALPLLAIALNSAEAQSKASEFFSPAWSHDGQTIVFETASDSGRYAVESVRADGSQRRTLTTGRYDNYAPQFSLDDRLVTFASTRDGHPEVYVMNADGTQHRRITNTPGGRYSPGCFSRSGAEVALTGVPVGANGNTRLFVVRTDGTGLRALTDSTATVRDVSCANDGQRILYSSRPASNRDWVQLTPAERDSIVKKTELYAIRFDGTQKTRVTTNDLGESGAAWNADGRTISFFTRRGTPSVLHRITLNADGSNTTIKDDVVPTDGTYSPDGKLVAFTKREPGVAGLYIRTVATGEERRVAGNP